MSRAGPLDPRPCLRPDGPVTKLRFALPIPVGLTAALLALLFASATLAAQPVFPPGSRIGLVPPPNMVQARGLSGFRNAETGAGILLVEMPVDAYPGLAASLSDEALKAQGFALRSRDTPQIGERPAILVTGTQSENGRSSIKSMLLTNDSTMTVLVMGQLAPDAAASEIEAVEKALRTVSIRPPLTLDETIAALPFAIGDKAGMRPVRAMAGNALMLTVGPNDFIREADQPTLIIAQSFGQSPPAAQREAFARSGLASNSFVKDAVLERSQSYRQGGSDWHELVAKAKDALSGRDVIVMQTIRFEPDGYIRSVGITRPEGREEALARFRRVVDSVASK